MTELPSGNAYFGGDGEPLPYLEDAPVFDFSNVSGELQTVSNGKAPDSGFWTWHWEKDNSGQLYKVVFTPVIYESDKWVDDAQKNVVDVFAGDLFYQVDGNTVQADIQNLADIINATTPETGLFAAGSGNTEGNVNNDPIGKPEIVGDLQQDQTLTLDLSDISDVDGLGSEGFSFQWLADGQIISEATNDSFTLTQDEVGKVISVSVSYTDGWGTYETLTSDVTAEVANVNDDPVGKPEIIGMP